MKLNNSCLKLALAAFMILLPGIAWGNDTYKASLTVNVGTTGGGKVYVNHNSNTPPEDSQYGTTKSDSNDGESSSSPKTFTFYIYYQQDPGYKFDGWTPTNATIASDNKTVTVSVSDNDAGNSEYDHVKSASITATFSPKPYTITYTSKEPCTGLPYPDTEHKQQYNIERNQITLSDAVPKRDGFEFTGWTASFEQGDSDHGGWSTEGTYSDGQTITTDKKYYGNVTLTAGWNVKNYTINYDLDGGENSPNNPTTYNITKSITLSNPSRDGFIFDGWTLESSSDDCNWEEKITSPTISLIPTGCIGDVTLKANWTKEGDPHYIKVTITNMKKDDHAIFDITYGSVNQQIAIHEYAIVKIPGRYETVTVTPSRWTEKTYNITPAAEYTNIDVSSGTRINPTTFNFSAKPKSGQNIFETSREF